MAKFPEILTNHIDKLDQNFGIEGEFYGSFVVDRFSWPILESSCRLVSLLLLLFTLKMSPSMYYTSSFLFFHRWIHPILLTKIPTKIYSRISLSYDHRWILTQETRIHNNRREFRRHPLPRLHTHQLSAACADKTLQPIPVASFDAVKRWQS